jgi:tetratricopeptide (TPR) repeat protein
MAIAVLVVVGLAAPFMRGDETALRSLAHRFYTAYSKKDPAALLSLWSPKSPERQSWSAQAQQLFDKNAATEIAHISTGDLTIEGGKATVRVAVSMTALNGPRVLSLVKEAGGWKVWSESPAGEWLAGMLVTAKTEEERAVLLRDNKALVTPELARALLKQADNLRIQGSYMPALSINRLALDISEKLDDQPGAARALNNIGAIHYAQGEYAQALEHLEQSLTISEQLGERAIVGRAHNNIGGIHFVQGNYSKMLAHLQKSLAISQEMGDTKLIAGSFINIGIAYLHQGSYARASEYFHQGLATAERGHDEFTMSRALNNIGTIHSAQGNQAQALDSFLRSLKLKEKLGDKAGISAALINIADVHVTQGAYSRALDSYNQALALARTIKEKPLVAEILNHLGELHELRGKSEEASVAFRESLALTEELGDKGKMARALYNIGDLHRKQGKPDALEFSGRASAIAREIGDRERLWKARTTAGQIHLSLWKIPEARVAFSEAIEAIEAMRDQVSGGEQERQGFFENKLAPYHGMMELVAGHGTARDVLAYAERAKARVLLDVLARGRVNVTKAMTPQESEQEQALRGELVGLNGLFYRENARPKPDQVRLRGLQKRLERARLAYSGFQTKLYALHPELKVRRGDFTPVSLEEAAELLPGPNGAILEYEVTDKRTYLLVLTRTGSEPRLQLYPVEIDSEKLKRQVESFRDQVSRRDLGFRQAAASLYDLLLRPARRQLAGRKSLIVAPDGPLWELPFQALQAAANRYVLEEYAISYAPSIAVLREMRRLGKHAEGKRELADSVWAIGNPAPHAQREPLPETERQVKELARLYGPARAKVYVGREAREERFKAEAGRFGLVHLATHGVLNDVSPMY